MSKVENMRKVAQGTLAVVKGQEATEAYLLQLAHDSRRSGGFRSEEEYVEYCNLIPNSRARLLVWDALIAGPAVSTLALISSVAFIDPGNVGSGKEIAIKTHLCSSVIKCAYLGVRAGFVARDKACKSVDDGTYSSQSKHTTYAFAAALAGSVLPFPGTSVMAFPMIAIQEHGDFATKTISLFQGCRQHVPDGGNRLLPYGSEYMRAV